MFCCSLNILTDKRSSNYDSILSLTGRVNLVGVIVSLQ